MLESKIKSLEIHTVLSEFLYKEKDGKIHSLLSTLYWPPDHPAFQASQADQDSLKIVKIVKKDSLF